MDIHEIINYIDKKMTEISAEDERNSNTWGPHGYGGPNNETRQKLEVYGMLLDLFNDLSVDHETGKKASSSSLDIKEIALCDFCEWFLDKCGKWGMDDILIKRNRKVGNRFNIMEIE